MKLRMLAAGTVSLCAVAAWAQQPAPNFAPPNLGAKGVRALAFNCAPCHGTGGLAAPGSKAGSLAGRPAADIASAMRQFREGTRQATVMQQIAKGFGDDEIAALAEHFSRLPRG
jgi:sulfide dehydrogenase cytochrome subunit